MRSSIIWNNICMDALIVASVWSISLNTINLLLLNCVFAYLLVVFIQFRPMSINISSIYLACAENMSTLCRRPWLSVLKYLAVSILNFWYHLLLVWVIDDELSRLLSFVWKSSITW
jgi:hypothetical protein